MFTDANLCVVGYPDDRHARARRFCSKLTVTQLADWWEIVGVSSFG
jgi:hypothetical protein